MRLRFTSATWAPGAVLRHELFWMGAIVVATVLLYVPMLNDWFQADDFFFLRTARFAGLASYSKDVFSFTAYSQTTNVNLPSISYRPLYFISFRIMYVFFGMNPLGYHVVSLVVHMVNTVLTWRIAKRILGGSFQPLVASMVFAVHPAYAESVAWIADVGNPLATLGALLALLLLFKSVESDHLRAGWYCSSVLLYAAATFVHQEVIPWAVIYVAALVLASWRAKGRVRIDRWPLMVPYCAVALATLLVQRQVPTSEPTSIGTHMLTYFKNYLSESIYPLNYSNANAHFAAFVVMLLIVALVPAVRLLVRRGAIPVTELFLVLWFLVAVVPLTTLAIHEPAYFYVGVFSRKLYVAGASIALLVVSLGASLSALVPPRMTSVARIAAVAVLVVGLGFGLKVANDRRDDMSDKAGIYERYTDQMRAAVPSVPTGGTLYVVGAPPLVLYFHYYVAIAQVYYGRVDAELIDEQRARELEKALPPGTAVFHYQP